MASHNPGYITASTVSPFLTGKGDKLLAGGITAAKKIAMERSRIVSIENDAFSGNSATEWGNEHDAYDVAERMLKDNAEVEAEAIITITEIIEEIRSNEK